ncbi:MAG TPA: hypothetical protein VF062_22265 [Candidatus Limnocylindrales bacterium]
MSRAVTFLLAAFGGITIAWGLWTWARVTTERWHERHDHERRNPYS